MLKYIIIYIVFIINIIKRTSTITFVNFFVNFFNLKIKVVGKKNLQNYSKLKLQIKLEDILEYCKKLEQFIHENSFKLIINNGVSIYEYQKKQLFKFESLKKHLFYNLQSYLKLDRLTPQNRII